MQGKEAQLVANLSPTERFQLLVRSLSENYQLFRPFIIDFKGDQKNMVQIPPDHRLYHFCLAVLAASRFDGETTTLAYEMANNAATNIFDNVLNLTNQPKIDFKDEKEQYRWAVFVNAVYLACCHIYTKNLLDQKGFCKQYSDLNTHVRTLLKLIKSNIKSNQKIIRRMCNNASYELDITMGKHCLDMGNLDLSEDYLNRAARSLSKCYHRYQEEYKVIAYMIHSNIAEIHLRRGDLLAAEAQYDHAMRYVAQKISFLNLNDLLRSGKITIEQFYYNLAIEYGKKNNWHAQKRVLNKSIECCQQLAKTYLGQFSVVNAQVKLTERVCRTMLHRGQFFYELPHKVANLCTNTDKNVQRLDAKDHNSFLRLQSACRNIGILDVAKTNVETLTIVLAISDAKEHLNIAEKLVTVLYPQQPRKKSVKKQTKKVAALSQPTSKESTDDENEGLRFSESIFTSFKKLQKRNPNSKNKGNAKKFSTDQLNDPVALPLVRKAPQHCQWLDDRFGEIKFPSEREDLVVVEMRNAFNCGKTNFAVIPKDLLLQRIAKSNGDQTASAILSHIINTLTEAKQVGFWGRGVKSCPNEPIVNGTPYKEKLKPSTGYEFNYRVYGRKISNGEHVLHIFDAIDLKPKGSASKLEVLISDTQHPVQQSQPPSI